MTDYVIGKVSVIIPAYNCARYLGDAIHSALKQRVDNLEIILVDDGSTDNTTEILAPFMNRIKYVFQHNEGPSAARNRGIVHSTGEFIQFLDADDILGPDSIELQLQYLRQHPDVHIAVCRNELFENTRPDGNPISSGSWELFCHDLDVHLCHFNIAPTTAFFCRRRAIIETGWFDTTLWFCEDYDFWLRAAVRGFVPHYNSNGFVYYRRHEGSLSSDRLRLHSHDAILHQRLSDLLDQCPNYPEGKRLEGLLAFSSGALFTAERLYGHKVDVSQQMMELALERLLDARQIAVSGNNSWTVPMRLYACKIISCLSSSPLRDTATARHVYQAFLQIQLAMKAPTTTISLFGKAFSFAITGPRHSILERCEILRYSAQALFHSLLSRLDQHLLSNRLFQRLSSQFNEALTLSQLLWSTFLLTIFLCLKVIRKTFAKATPTY